MRERGQKVGAAGHTRFHNTLWNKIGSDCTSCYIDQLIHSVFVENLTVSQFCDSDTQIQTIYFYLTEVYGLITLVGSVRYPITLLKYTFFSSIVELHPII